MIKKFIVTACFFLSIASFAQSGSASPYSYFGIGEVRFKGTLENRSMSGIGIEQDSIHINLMNPASFASLRLTTFTMGGSYTSTTLKSESESAKAQRSTLDYIAVALPLGKLGVGFGLLPYSSVGYNIVSLSSDANLNSSRLTGTGGLNKTFLAVGYTIVPNLVVGADIQYNFGKINNTTLKFLTEIPVGTYEENESTLSGLNVNFGAMYQRKINEKLNFFSSLSFSPESKLSSKNVQRLSAVQYDPNYNLVRLDASDENAVERNLTMPSKFSFGAGFGQSKKWLLGTQIIYQTVGDLANQYNSSANVSYENYTNYSLGGYYIPNYKVFSKYYERVTYRAGMKFGKTGINVNSKSISETALTLGFGLPTTGALSNFNLGLEYGKRGTTLNGLIQENYATLSISFSLNDKWFRQYKIN